MMAVEDIRARLILRRRSLKLSQRVIAARMGCSQANVSELERGVVANPGYSTLMKWAAAVGLDFHMSFTDDDAHQRAIDSALYQGYERGWKERDALCQQQHQTPTPPPSH